MARNTPPLSPNLPMVDPDTGQPTPFFMRWWQDQIDTNLQIVPLSTQEEVSEVLDLIGATQGSIIYRDASLWQVLTPGTADTFLQTKGAGANPVWASFAAALDDLSDVSVSGATDGQVLGYDVVSGVGTWVPIDVAAGDAFDGTLTGAEVDVSLSGATSVSSSAYATKGNYYLATSKHQITEVTFDTSTDHDGEVYVAITDGSNVITSLEKKAYTAALVTGTGSGRNNVIVLDTPVVVESGDRVHFGITRTDGVATTSNGVYFDGTPPSGPWTNPASPSQRTADLDLQVGDTIGGGGFFTGWWSIALTYQPINTVILPTGGTDGQVLTKQSSDDYDADWETPATPTIALDDLTDVDTTGVTDGQFFGYEVVSGVGSWGPVAAPSGGGGTTACTYEYWRLRFTESGSFTGGSLAELQLRGVVGGADQCEGGTASAFSEAFGAASNAFDNNSGTLWAGSAGDITSGDAYLQYQFADPVWVAEYSLLSRSPEGAQTPRGWVLEYSDDGSTWTAADTISGESSFGNGELREYTTSTAKPEGCKPYESIIVAASDETTALTTGTGKVTFRMPYDFNLAIVRASVTTAPTDATLTVDINEGGTTILSTKLTIDSTEKTSTTAATPAVISDPYLADDAEITIDIDQIGSTIAGAGLKVTLLGWRL